MMHTATDNGQRIMDIQAILNGPEYMRCERTHTKMKKEECIKRRKGVKRVYGHQPGDGTRYYHDIPPECRGCEQGEEIGRGLSQINADNIKDRASPRRYSARAARRRKEEVKEMEGEKNSQKTVQTCDECESTDIKARGKCALHYNRWYMRQKSKAGGKTLREQGVELGAALPEEIEAQRKMIMLDFAEYADMLEELETLAKEELRPVEMQAMFLIKKGLEDGESSN